MNCRICKNKNLKEILNLGHTPLADAFLSKNDLNKPEKYYPLVVLFCDCCGLLQLSYVVSPQELYQQNYPYESSITKSGVNHFHSFAKHVCKRFNLCENDLVIDIGSNVGVLLEGFKKCGVKILGIDPSKTVYELALKRNIPTLNEFFSIELSRKLIKNGQQAKIITGTNVVAHIDDLHSLMEAVNALMTIDGVFIIEAPYLIDLIENLEYDTIYHEHLSYLSIKPLKYLCNKHGMEIIDVEKYNIHGGTLRYYVSRKNTYDVSKNVEIMELKEQTMKIHTEKRLLSFGKSVEQHRADLVWMLKRLKQEGKQIVGVSAPAKGMTLLNYCKLGSETLDYLTEVSTLKIGKYAPGSHLYIKSDDELMNDVPDYALLLAWNFSKEIMNNLKEYISKGGKFIVPIPKPQIIDDVKRK